ncbi:hypothetical protein D6158_24780 [Nocardia seriolae]|nr:hypothetical protein D6158_24780 [Nocardia seriolae]
MADGALIHLGEGGGLGQQGRDGLHVQGRQIGGRGLRGPGLRLVAQIETAAVVVADLAVGLDGPGHHRVPGVDHGLVHHGVAELGPVQLAEVREAVGLREFGVGQHQLLDDAEVHLRRPRRFARGPVHSQEGAHRDQDAGGHHARGEPGFAPRRGRDRVRPGAGGPLQIVGEMGQLAQSPCATGEFGEGAMVLGAQLPVRQPGVEQRAGGLPVAVAGPGAGRISAGVPSHSRPGGGREIAGLGAGLQIPDQPL